MENPWVIGFTTTIVGGLLLSLLARFRGWWWWKKKPASIDLATRVLTFLETDAEDNTREMISNTKKLGDSLIASINTKVAHDTDVQYAALDLIHQTLERLKPFVSELTAADEELDYLKRLLDRF